MQLEDEKIHSQGISPLRMCRRDRAIATRNAKSREAIRLTVIDKIAIVVKKIALNFGILC